MDLKSSGRLILILSDQQKLAMCEHVKKVSLGAITNPDGGMCLFNCIVGGYYLHQLEIPCGIVGGSMLWESHDYGDGSHHVLEYRWDPLSPRSQAALAKGSLPEVHCWIVVDNLDETYSVVDFSTAHFPEQLAELDPEGVGWSKPPPPPYLWATHDDLPKEACYTVDPHATVCVREFVTAFSRHTSHLRDSIHREKPIKEVLCI